MSYLRLRAATSPVPESLLATHTLFISSLLAEAVLRHLLGLDGETAGTAVVIDLATGAWRREVVLAVPGCPDCAGADAASTPTAVDPR